MSMDRFGDKVCCNPNVKLKKQESYPVIDIDKITPGYKAVRSVASIEYTGQGGAKFQDHDVLFARITPCLENGKMAIADTEGQNGIGSTELFVFRGIDGVSDTDYVYYLENMEIVVFLFARPTEEKILKEFEYIHYNSARYCSIYAIGYTDDFTKAEDRTYRKVDAMMQQDWYFSMKAFTEFKEKLQNRIHWDYSGETEILILQNNPGKRNILNFQNYVAIDVNKGIREGYIDSFQSFMESLIRSSKRRVTAKEAIRDVRNARISIKDIIAGAIDDCKKVPTPIKEIAKDRLFYRCANTML